MPTGPLRAAHRPVRVGRCPNTGPQIGLLPYRTSSSLFVVGNPPNISESKLKLRSWPMTGPPTVPRTQRIFLLYAESQLSKSRRSVSTFCTRLYSVSGSKGVLTALAE